MRLPKTYDRTTKLVHPDRHAVDFFKGGSASGITVHYTADRDVERTLDALDDAKLAYHILIERDGTIVQNCYLDQTCYHAGKAKWVDKSPNRCHISVAIVSYGKLTKYRDGTIKSWNGVEIPTAEIAYRKDNVFGVDEHWDKATSKQVAALFDFCLWACNHGISPDHICGHDECALPLGRKTDPGGVLPTTMDGFRQTLFQTMFLN